MIARKHRFSRKASVVHVLKKGQNIKADGFSIRVFKSRHQKLAIVVSKKVDKRAVGRNRIRRRIYEAARPLIEESVIIGETVIIVQSKELAELPFEDLRRRLVDALKQAE